MSTIVIPSATSRTTSTTAAALVKPGGQIGIVVPGVVSEFEEPPAHLEPLWERDWEWWSFHSPEWWRRHWTKTRLVEVEVADLVPNGWQHWVHSDEASLELGFVPPRFALDLPHQIELMRMDAGRNLGFTRLVGRRVDHARRSAAQTGRSS